MEKLHHRLKQKSAWYGFWHNEPHHQKAHWVLFLLVAILFSALIVLRISENTLQGRFSDASSQTVTVLPGQTQSVAGVRVLYNLPPVKRFFSLPTKPLFSIFWKDQSTTISLNNPSCGEVVACTYLGARFWGTDSIIDSSPKQVSIDWA